jgi:hypothetical protein
MHNKDSTHVWNVGILLWVYTVLYPRRLCHHTRSRENVSSYSVSLAPTYKSTWHYCSEDQHWYRHSREYLRSHIFKFLFALRLGANSMQQIQCTALYSGDSAHTADIPTNIIRGGGAKNAHGRDDCAKEHSPWWHMASWLPRNPFSVWGNCSLTQRLIQILSALRKR